MTTTAHPEVLTVRASARVSRRRFSRRLGAWAAGLLLALPLTGMAQAWPEITCNVQSTVDPTPTLTGTINLRSDQLDGDKVTIYLGNYPWLGGQLLTKYGEGLTIDDQALTWTMDGSVFLTPLTEGTTTFYAILDPVEPPNNTYGRSFPVVVDFTGPTVASVAGSGYGVRIGYQDVGGWYDAANPSALEKTNYSLFASGDDGTFGDRADVDLTGTIQSVSYVADYNTYPTQYYARLDLSTPLGSDVYLLRIKCIDGVHDNVGHWLQGNVQGGAYFEQTFDPPPAVTNVTSTAADGVYTLGNVIDLVVQFSEPVNVAPAGMPPALILNTDPYGSTNDAAALYVSGSGTTDLVFQYAVGANQVSPDLDYTSSAMVSLNGGTISSLTDAPADVTLAQPGQPGSLGANKNIVIEDGVPPTVTGVSAGEWHLVVSYSDAGGMDPFSAGNIANYGLVWAGPDGIFDTGDDEDMLAARGLAEHTYTLSPWDKTQGMLLMLFAQPLPGGEHRLTINGQAPDGVKDQGGNYLATATRANYVSVLTVVPEQVQTAIFQGQISFSSGGQAMREGERGGEGGSGPAVGDLNGDGSPDLVDAAMVSSGIMVFRARLGLGNGNFGPQSREYLIPGGSSMGGMPPHAMADFNGDGKLDLVLTWTTDYITHYVRFYPGDGTGGFGAPVDTSMTFSGLAARSGVSSSEGWGEIACADVNHDGIPDLIGIESYGQWLGVLYGNGDGTFAPPVFFPSAPDLFSLQVGDFNGDGWVDAVTFSGQWNSPSSAVFLNSGSNPLARSSMLQQFLPRTDYLLRDSMAGAAVGDLDGDAALDLVTVHDDGGYGQPGTVAVYLGNGDGTFATPATTFPGPLLPSGVAITPADGDAIPDLVVFGAGQNNGSYVGTYASTYPGVGDGTFAAPIVSGAGPYSWSVTPTPADFNGDGRLDFFVSQAHGPTYVVLGNPDGTFGATVYGVGQMPKGIHYADLNGDGTPDLLTANATAGTVSVLYGQGDGTFAATREVIATAAGNFLVATANLNDDSHPELIVATAAESYQVEIFVWNGEQWFQMLALDVGGAPSAMVVADIDGDGHPDLAVTCQATNSVRIFWGDAAFGGMEPNFPEETDLTVGTAPAGLAVADVDRDGQLDLVTANQGDGTWSVLLASVAERGRSFADAVAVAVAGGAKANSVVVTDLDGDTWPDLASTTGTVGSYDSFGLYVALSHGDGTWGAATPYFLPYLPSGNPVPQSLVTADFDADGRPDMAAAGVGGALFALWRNTGDGTFKAADLYASSGGIHGLCAGDFNHDGKPDLAATESLSNQVLVHRNILTNAVAAPVITPPGGTVDAALDVTIGCATAGASIRYTTDGSTPTLENGDPIMSGGTVAVTGGVTIKAAAFLEGMDPSPVSTAVFVFAPRVPVIAPNGGAFNEPQQVAVTCATPNTTIRYTLDGSDPNETSTDLGVGGTVTVQQSLTLKARAYREGWTPSGVAAASFVLQPVPPVVVPAGGTFNEPQEVTVTCATPDTTLRYSTDGNDPTEASPVAGGRGTVPVDRTMTLKVRAFRPNWAPSAVVSHAFVIQPLLPAIVPNGGTFNAVQEVTISCGTADATITYTTDQSEPTALSPEVPANGTVMVDHTLTLKARAFRADWTPSDVASADFTLQLPAPTFNPDGGTFNDPLVVGISSDPADATIRYTLDGTEPTEASPVLGEGGSVPVDHSLVLKAKAWKAGWEPSAVASAAFTLQPLPPTFAPDGGSFTAQVSVTVACLTPAVTIRYTTDGSEPTAGSDAVASGGQISVDRSLTVKARAWRAGWEASDVAVSGLFTIAVGPPEFAPDGGLFHVPQTVTITTPTADATLYYTLDGTDPTDGTDRGDPSPTVPANGEVTVDHSLTLKARGYKVGLAPSSVTSTDFVLQALPPTFTPDGGIFNAPVPVTLASATADATIYYTLDGTLPGAGSANVPSGGSITITQSATLTAVAARPGWESSAPVAADFIVDLTPPYVVSHEPNGVQFGARSAMCFLFSESMAGGSFDLGGDVVSLTGPQGAIAPTAFEWLAEDLLEVRFAAQTQSGTYTMVIGPAITDLAGNPLDQNDNGVAGEEPQDCYSGTFILDNSGPRIIDQNPKNGILGPADSITFTFSEPIDPGSFDLRQDIVSFSGPQGPLAANHFQWLDSVTLRLDFAAQSGRGLYRMVVGPLVNDVFGNPMDQNQNQLNGEQPQDRYTAEFAIVQGPHVTGHFPFGDQVLPVAFVDVTFSDSMLASSFLTGDDIAISVEGTEAPVPTVAGNPVYTAATRTFRLTFAAPVAAPGVYRIVLGPSITNVRGDLMDQDRDAVLGEPQQDCYDAGFTILDVAGPQVTSHVPTRSSGGGGIDHADFTFSEAVDPDSFTAADVQVTDPTGLPVTVTGVSALSGQILRVSFAAQTVPGTYHVRIGPDIRDLAGNQMNQDGDRTNGEAGDDRFLASITVDTSGPSALGFAFTPPQATAAAAIDVTFSEDVQGASLDPADATVTGPAGACAVTGVTLPSPNLVRIAFTSPAQSGRFQFTLGPGIEDGSGNPMDQNGDGTPGDGFAAAFDQHLPDLAVTGVRHPAEARANQSIEVVWTVANHGSGIAAGAWVDRVTISPAAAGGRVDPVELGALAFSGPLAAGATYTRALAVTIPDGYTGSYWITVASDVTGQVFEVAPDSNNAGRGTSPLLVTARPAADLQVTDVVAPAKIHIDSTIQVTWTVKNLGDGASSARGWVDRVYLSANNNLLDRAADTVLTPDSANPGSLTPGDDYTRTATLRVPASLAPGAYYVLVKTDATDVEEEFANEENNVGASASPVPAAKPTPAILEVSDVHLVPPGTTVAGGQRVTIQWTVTNTGEQTPGSAGGWYSSSFGFDHAMVISANPWVSFSPGQALFYHQAVYHGAFTPGTAAVFTEQVTIPEDLRGTQYLIPWVDPPQWTGLDKLLMPLELTVTAPAQPDLVPVAEDFVVPPQLVAGQPATFSWTVRNDGTAAATQEWTNVLVFQRQAGEATEEVEIGRFRYANGGGLAIGGVTAPFVLTPVLPRVQAGTWNVVLRLLAAGSMHELDSDNNSLTSMDHVVTAPVADLTPTAFACSAAAAPVGSVVRFTWSVRYNGDAPSFPDSWTDTILLSPDGSIGAAVQIGQLAHAGAMADNDAYTDVGLDVTLPTHQSGSFHVLLLVDAGDKLYEPGAEANNVLDLGQLFTLQAPNLQAQISSPPTAGVAGQSLTLLWDVRNVGTAVAVPYWVDACYLSADAVLNPATDQLLLSVPHLTPLAPGGAAYPPGGAQGMTVTLPDDFEGSAHLFLVADVDHQLYELGSAEADNILDVPITVTDFAPDLRIQDAVAPTTGVAGEPILINWRVYNRGDAPAEGSWRDALYLSADTTFDPETDLLFSKPAPNKVPVPVDDFYEPVLNLRDIQARLPARIEGRFYIFIVADVDQQLYERAAGETNNVLMVPTPVQVQNLAPDLRVLAVTPAVRTVPAGSAISVTWTVRNDGARPTTEGYWEDGVLLSRDRDLDPPSDVLLGTVVRTANVAAGADYSVTAEFVLRQDLEGPFYLYVVTDLRRHVYEFTGEGNNTTAAAQPLEIIGLHADLRVTQFDAALRTVTVTAGDLLNLSWTVTNAGTTPTGAGAWTDGVYLSSDPVLDSADTPVHQARHSGVLGPAGSYAVAAAPVRLPPDRTGTWYLIVKADAGQFNDVYEANAEDNNASVPLELTIDPMPLPNLIPSAVTPQAAPAWSGQPFTLSWTETNAGNAAAVSNAADGQWYATVYLSRDTYLDPLVDLGLGNTRVAGPLADGGRAAVQRQLDTRLPNGISGPYYLIVKTDPRDEVVENDETDNTACSAIPLDVQLTPPADLVVDTVSPPGAAGYYGDLVSWGFTVANASTTDAARGAWADSIYLSADATWDVFDLRIGRVPHAGQGDLDPQATYTESTDAPIPAVLPGDYYVLVRTDVADDVRETDETNNTSAAAAFTVLGRPLNLNQAEAGSLDPRTGEVYYQIDGIEAGKTLLLAATGSRGLTVSVRFGALPTRSRSDATGEGSCTVRNTQAGTYYILLDGTGSYDLLATTAPYGIAAVDPDRAGNTGEVTVRVTGSEFTAGTIVELLDGSGGVIRTGRVWFADSTELYVTFDLAGVTPGACFLAAREPGRATGGTVPFEVLEGGVGSFFSLLVVPPTVRAGRPMTLKVVYGNDGSADVAAPLLVVRVPAGMQWRLTAAEAFHTRPIQLFAASMSGDPAILRPGSRYEVPIEFQGNVGGQFCFPLEAIATAASSGMDWVGFEQQVRPGPNDDPLMVLYWREVWAQFISRTGPTAGGFVAELANAARLHLLRRGSRTRDLGDLLGADFAEILAFLPGSFSGTVQLVSGAGPSVSGAELVLYNPATGDAGTAISEADGTVRFLDLPAGEYQSFATNYLLSPATVSVPPMRDQGWTVTVGGGMAGRVLTAPADDLSNDYVLLRHEGGQYYLAALNSDGDYVRLGLPDGRFSAFFAGTATQTPARLDDIEVASPTVTAAPGLQCALGGTIEGLVTTPARGALAEVSVVAYDNTDQAYSALTSADGSYRIGPLPPGQYTLEAASPGYEDVTMTDVAVLMGGAISRLDLAMPGAGPLTGSVGAIRGTIEGLPATASVYVVPAVEQRTVPTTCVQQRRTGVPGPFAFGGLPPGTYDVVVVVAGLCAPVPLVQQVQVQAGEITDVAFDNLPVCSGGPNTFSRYIAGAPPVQVGSLWDEQCTLVLGSHDPNDKLVAVGTGPGHAILPGTAIPYTIRFENDAKATASVQLLTITDPISPLLDPNSFEFADMEFQNIPVPVPAPGLKAFTVVVDLRPYGTELLVEIVGTFDVGTGLAEWVFTALDPLTGEFTNDPFIGFLPPNDDIHSGEGFVKFSAQPRADLPSGSVIENVATIVFDWNEPMDTPLVFNTIDSEAPTSVVLDLPALSPEAFALTWSGQDDNGVAAYDIYVSTDGVGYSLWLPQTSATTAVFPGVPGQQYWFYSLATDWVGHRQAVPGVAATTTAVAVPTIALTDPPFPTTVNPGDLFRIEWLATDPGLLNPTITLYWDADTSVANNVAPGAWGVIAADLPYGDTLFDWTVPGDLGTERVYLLARIAQAGIAATDYTADTIGIGDVDHDGMIDSWEQAAIDNLGGGMALADFAPGADSDGDGWTNLDEYAADSDPANPNSKPDWRMALYLQGDDAGELVFGYAQTGSAGWDEGLDIDGSNQMAWLAGPASHPYLDRSILGVGADLSWPLEVGIGAGRGPVDVTWDSAEVPPDFGLFLTPAAGPGRAAGPSYDMVANSGVRLTEATALNIELVPPQVVTYEMQFGWNLLSLPCQASDNRVSNLFGALPSGHLWTWAANRNGRAGGYDEPVTLDAKQGFWVYWAQRESLQVRGRPLRSYTVDLQAGWNLVGPVAASRLPDVPQIRLPAWWWNAAALRYERVVANGPLSQGTGYWIYCTAPVTVELAPAD